MSDWSLLLGGSSMERWALKGNGQDHSFSTTLTSFCTFTLADHVISACFRVQRVVLLKYDSLQTCLRQILFLAGWQVIVIFRLLDNDEGGSVERVVPELEGK